jgi:hypothetical protein
LPAQPLAFSVDGTVSPVQASFTYGFAQPTIFHRMPTTSVVAVPLTLQPQFVEAIGQGVRGSTVIIDSPATLSASI